jgi:hypothetical protein
MVYTRFSTGSNPVLTTQKTRNEVSLPQRRWVLVISNRRQAEATTRIEASMTR